MTRHKILSLVMLSVLAIAGPATAQDGMENVVEMMEMIETTEPVVLTDGDIETWISTVETLIDSGIDDLTSEQSIGAAMQTIGASAQAKSILSRSGYDLESFQNTSLNIAMAMGAAEMAENRPELEASLSQMEAMKGQIPAEQYEMMSRMVKGAMAMFEKTPEQNIETVAKYADRIDALGSE
ncbi:MAG: hypothetical protein AAFN07_06560 [Pseudomonadota bacterium]